MSALFPTLIPLILSTGLLFMAGCSSNKSRDIEIDTYVTARTTINPDINGEARPINLTLYYLNDAEAFTNAGFFDLYGKAEETLGDALLKVQKIQAQPGSKQHLLLESPLETKAVGIVAAFRHVDKSEWSDHVLTLDKCFIFCKPGLKHEDLFIEIKRLSVGISLEGEKFKTANPPAKKGKSLKLTKPKNMPDVKAPKKMPEASMPTKVTFG